MTFERAVSVVLKAKGGYIDSSFDKGRATKFGISQRSYPNIDIKNLTIDQAKMIYKKDYWDKIKGDELGSDIGIVLLDIAVNAGVSQGIKLLQKCVDTVQDGVIGPVTIHAANKSTETAKKLTQERIMFYTNLANFNIFGRGWINRSIDTLLEAKNA